MFSIKENYLRIAVTIFCSLILTGIVFLQVFSALKLTGGVFNYPLDDTYLHMAIARNIAEHGVWGITKYGFSSTSSSMFYTFLLTGIFKLFGTSALVPFIINIFTGVSVLLVFAFIAKKENFSSLMLLFLLLSVIIFTPLPVLMISGMEHTIQICLFALYIYIAAGKIAGEKQSFRILYLLSPLVVMLRYEGLFLIGIVSALLLLRKQYQPAVIIFLTGIMPVVIYGFISLSKGSLFLPNTIAIKGGMPEGTQENIIIYYAYNWFRRMFLDLHLLSVFLLLLSSFSFIYFVKRSLWNRKVLFVLIILLLYIAHLMFAATGWLYRYEAYLVALAILAGFIVFHPYLYNKKPVLIHFPFYIAFSLLLLSVFYPLIKRSYYAFTQTVQATVNIYDQHYQMTAFVKKHYNESSLAANDIGAISFYTDARMLDLSGLGSIEIIRLRLAGDFNAETIEKLASEKKVEMAMIYDKWFAGKIPASWKKVAEWEIKNNVICADKTVSFYATSGRDNYKKLEKALDDFSDTLPDNVIHRNFGKSTPEKQGF